MLSHISRSKFLRVKLSHFRALGFKLNFVPTLSYPSMYQRAWGSLSWLKIWVIILRCPVPFYRCNGACRRPEVNLNFICYKTAALLYLQCVTAFSFPTANYLIHSQPWVRFKKCRRRGDLPLNEKGNDLNEITQCLLFSFSVWNFCTLEGISLLQFHLN